MLELCNDGKKTKDTSLATLLPAPDLLGAMSTENHSAMIRDKGIVGFNVRKGDALPQVSPDKGKSDV